MDDRAIVALLSGIEPSEGEIPKPPFMAAVPAGPVIESGADLDAVEAWVKARGGWTHRAPAHLDADRPPLFFIVPKGHLQAGPGPPSLTPVSRGGGAPVARPPRRRAARSRGGPGPRPGRAGQRARGRHAHGVRGHRRPRRGARLLRARARAAGHGPEPDRDHVRLRRDDAAGRARREAGGRALHGARLHRHRHGRHDRGRSPSAASTSSDSTACRRTSSASGTRRVERSSRGSRTPTATCCR